MTRAKDISKIITDADFSGTLDVAGELQVGVDGTTAGLIRLMDSGSVTEEATISTDANGGLIFGGNSGPGELIFRTGSSTERLKIDSSGDFLFLGGTIRIKDSGNTAQRGAIYGSSSEFHLNAGVDNMVLTTSGGEAMRITSLGNVGINTSSPASPSGFGNGGILHLKGSANNDCSIVLEGLFGSGGRQEIGVSTGDLYFNRGAATGSMSTSMVIKSTGNVGIGTTSPAQKLEVSGKGVFSTANPDVNGLKITATTGTNASAMTFSNTATAYVGLDNSVGGRISGVPYGLAVWNGSAYPVVFGTNGSERMRIDSSGNVGIGGTSFNPKLYVLNSNAGPGLTAANATAVFHGSVDIGKGGCIGFDFGGSHTNYPVGLGYVITSQSGSTKGDLAFFTRSVTTDTAPTERMRIFSDGTVSVGSSSSTGGDQVKFHKVGNSGFLLNLNNAGQSSKNLISAQSGTAEMVHCQFNNSNGEVGTIKTLNSATHYNTSSDYRLKENVSYDFDATTRLKQLKPARFNFISDETNTLIDGFIAHEVSSIVPQAVMGEKDATETYTDDDGNEQTRIAPQSIDHSKLVPLLVKTIQELEARITSLETA